MKQNVFWLKGRDQRIPYREYRNIGVKMTKVLHYVSIMDRAGEETFIMNVFRTIDKFRVMFDFLVTQNREGDYDKEINNLGGRIRYLQLITSGGPLKRIKNFFVLKKALNPIGKEYTTFHIHTQHAMDAILDAMAAKFAGFRTVIVHSHSTSTLHHIKAHYICRPLLNYLPIIRLACSDKAGRWLFGEKGKFEIINNGIVTENFLFNQQVRERIRKEEGWGDKIVVGHVGSFTYPKNHTFLLEVFREFLKICPDALLVMAGKGQLMDDMKKKAKEIKVFSSTRFLGSRGDVNELYSAFDVLLFPSHYEGLPVTLVEAQAADLPCLISDVITKETDINPNLKRMSLNESAEKWSEQINTLLRQRKRKNTKESIAKSGFDIERTSKRLLEIYQ